MEFSENTKNLLRPIAKWFFKTAAYRAYEHSYGDWRYLYLPLVWKLVRVMVPRRLVHVGRVSFTLPCDNWITHFRWYLFCSKEVEVREFLDNYLKDGDVFFDIGANIGVFSVYALKRHFGLTAYCFEPEYSNLHYLKENIVANGLMDRANIYAMAVSDIDGISTLHIQDTTPGAAVHTESKSNINTTDEGYAVVWREGVAAVTLDRVCGELGVVPNAIKIDTDGNEGKILSGASKTLADLRLRSIVIELPPDEAVAQQCVDILGNEGFKLVWSRADTRNQVWSRTTAS